MSSLLFENLQLMKEAKQKINEGRMLNPSEFNKLKIALNKHNVLKNILVLSAISNPRDYKSNNYTTIIDVYGKFKEIDSYRSTDEGSGEKLYSIKINLINDKIEFLDSYNDSYIKKYIEYATKIDAYAGADPDQLYNTLMQVIEDSKKDIEEVLKSKNFIYNLTKHVKPHRSEDYTLDLDESTNLTEDFDPSMPNWLMRAIRINNQQYGREDAKYNYALDTLKWNNDTIPDKGKLDQYFDNGYIVAVLIDRSGDEHNDDYIVYAPSLYINNGATITINGRNRRIDSMSMKALTPYIKDIAIADRNNSAIQQKQRDRKDAKSGSIDRINPNDEYRYNQDIDKSGYIVDPNKYTKLLAQVHQEDYNNRLEDLYVVLSGVKDSIKEFTNRDDFLPDAKGTSIYDSKFERFNSIASSYKSAIYDYNYALKELDNISNAKNTEWSSTPAFKEFEKYINAAEENCAKVLTLIEKA